MRFRSGSNVLFDDQQKKKTTKFISYIYALCAISYCLHLGFLIGVLSVQSYGQVIESEKKHYTEDGIEFILHTIEVSLMLNKINFNLCT